MTIKRMIIPMGTFCLPTFLLKKIGLRKEAYPLDYCFCPLRSTIHLLETEFTELLNKAHLKCFIEPTDGRTVTSHSLYHPQMFNHQDLNDKNIYEKLIKRKNRLIERLNEGCDIVILLGHNEDYIKSSQEIIKISILIKKYNINNRILSIYLSYKDIQPKISFVTLNNEANLIKVEFNMMRNLKDNIICEEGSRLCQKELEKNF